MTIRYDEGAEVGYRWYAQKNHKPLYAFGHGLSYTTFAYKDFKVSGGETVTATFTVTNTGKVAGADIPQVYLTDAAGEKPMRLLAFERVELAPGASKTVTIEADPRLLARFDGKNGSGQWRIARGTYRIALGKSAGELVLSADTQLSARVFGKSGGRTGDKSHASLVSHHDFHRRDWPMRCCERRRLKARRR